MQTSNVAAIIMLSHTKGYIKARVCCNPGPFPFGPPGTMGRAQYIGIADHLVFTLMEDKYLTGLLPLAADVNHTPSGHPIQWVGGVQAQPWRGDFFYKIHPLFIRDYDQLIIDSKGVQIAGHVTGVKGRVSGRQYWLIEVPAITADVMLNIDEIVVVRRRKKWDPLHKMTSKVTRGEFWQCGGFVESPAYAAIQVVQKGAQDHVQDAKNDIQPVQVAEAAEK